MSGLRVNLNNAKLFHNLGHTLKNKTEALRYFKKATMYVPCYFFKICIRKIKKWKFVKF